MRINRSNRHRLNSSVSDNFGMHFSYSILDYPTFDEEIDAKAAIKYLNNLLEEKSIWVTDIEREGNYYRVSVQFDIDDATGYQAWLDGKMWHEEKSTNAIIENTLRNWGTIKNRLNSGRRAVNSSRFVAFDKSGRVKAGYGLPEEVCQIIVDRQTGANYVCLTNNEVDDVLEILASLHYEDIAEFSDAVMSGKHPEVDIVAGFRY